MNNKTINIVVAFIVFLGSISLGVKFLEKKIVKSVMLELKREYVPGPFSPGFDPDKVDPDKVDPNTDPIITIPDEEMKKIEDEAINSFNNNWR